MMTRDTSTMCPQWPDRCCLCMTKKDGVVLTGLVSMLADLAFIILCTYTTYQPEIWNLSKFCSFFFLDYVIPLIITIANYSKLKRNRSLKTFKKIYMMLDNKTKQEIEK